MRFREYLTEKYKNLLNKDKDLKYKYANEVYNMLQKSYKKIGGIKGSGFKSPQDMVINIPFWKLAFTKGELVAVIMYKDKGTGRKLVAIGSDGTQKGKKKLKEMFKHEFERSFMEVSGPLLKWLQKNFPDLVNKYKIDARKTFELLPMAHIELDNDSPWFYHRLIGGDSHEKILLGSPYKTIK